MEGLSMIPKTILFSHKQEKIRVAVYCRVSTNHLEQLGSLEVQKSYFQTMIRENPNWQFVKIYSDVGFALRTKKQTGRPSDDSRWEEGIVRFRSSKIIKPIRT
jgi:hypothetical protein